MLSWIFFCMVTHASYIPIVLWHGMGDTCCNPSSLGSFSEYLQEQLPNVFIHSIRIGENEEQDKEKGFFDQLERQVNEVCTQLTTIPELSDGFNAIGFSQGGQLLRAYVEKCNAPPILNLITLGSQHGGVSDIPGCVDKSDTRCLLARALINKGVYLPWVQNRVVQAQYFKNPKQYQEYLKYNSFLPDINNELQSYKIEYRDRLKTLNAFVMVKFDNDTMVVPKESSVMKQYLQSHKVYSGSLVIMNKENWFQFMNNTFTRKIY